MESARQGGATRLGSAQRYSRISLDLLLQYRTVLSRETDAEGRTSWTASLVGVPGFQAKGSSRTEALRRVREMASDRRSATAASRRQPASSPSTVHVERGRIPAV